MAPQSLELAVGDTLQPEAGQHHSAELWASPLRVRGEGQGEGAPPASATCGAPSPSAPKLRSASLRAEALSPSGRGVFVSARDGLRPGFNCEEKTVEHTDEVLEDLNVPVSDHQETSIFQVDVPFRVALAVRMLSAIDLDDDAHLETSEIDDPGADRHLALELVAAQPAITHGIPEPSFCVRHPAAEGLRTPHTDPLHRHHTPIRDPQVKRRVSAHDAWRQVDRHDRPNG